jgi:hypothetical protein
MIRFASTVLMVEFNRSRLIMITRFFVVFFFERCIYFTRLFILKTLWILDLLRIICVWILLIGFSFLATQNMGISNLIIFFIPRNLLMERGPIIHTITSRFFIIAVTLIRWKVLLIAIRKNLKSLMNFNLSCFCRFRLSIFSILFNHLLPSVFWIFLKLCGILDILIIFINLHFWRSLLILLVRWNVWFHKIWNSIQIFRLVFLRIFCDNMAFSFKMTSILLKIVLNLTFHFRIYGLISQETLRVKFLIWIWAWRHLLLETIVSLTLHRRISFWILLVHRCNFVWNFILIDKL